MTQQEYAELQTVWRQLERLAAPLSPDFNSLAPNKPIHDAIRTLAQAIIGLQRMIDQDGGKP